MSRDSDALALFERVADLDPPEQSAYLDRHCPNADLRRRVEAMLDADERAEGLLEIPAEGHLAALEPEAEAAIPDRIGPYEIVEPVGTEGRS